MKLENEIEKRIKEKTQKECLSGCTETQKLQIRNFNADKGFVELMKIINEKYDIGIGLFKGVLNTETENYEWQKVSE